MNSTDETQTQTLPEFAASVGITLQAVAVENPPILKDWQINMNHWRVTLRRRFTEIYTIRNERGDQVNGHHDRARSMTILFHTGKGIKRDPTVADVLSCLISDASGSDQSFADWCGDLGYDTDSRSAERVYKDCQREARRLRRFLGDDLYNAALYDVEPY